MMKGCEFPLQAESICVCLCVYVCTCVRVLAGEEDRTTKSVYVYASYDIYFSFAFKMQCVVFGECVCVSVRMCECV